MHENVSLLYRHRHQQFTFIVVHRPLSELTIRVYLAPPDASLYRRTLLYPLPI